MSFKWLSAICMAALILIINPTLAFAMDKLVNFNGHWLFTLDDNSAFKHPEFDDSQWRRISLPHDWSIEDISNTNSAFSADVADQYNTGYASGGTGWYRRHLPNASGDKAYYLVIDGIYMDYSIYINGQHIDSHYYGYTGYQIEITEYLNKQSTNVLAIRVNNNQKNSRWYSGSGIFRQLQLVTKPLHHLIPFATQIETQSLVADKASLRFRAQSSMKANHVSQKWSLEYEIRAKNGQPHSPLAKAVIPFDSDQITETITETITVENVQPWSPETPALYTLVLRLKNGETLIDQQQTDFGIRTVTVSDKHGLLINNKPVLLKGMNLHHDNYLLGAAAHPVAEDRKVQKILAAGYNAVRTSHNPPSSAFLVSADKHGLLIINEVFDAWNKHKWDNVNDYSSVFKDDWRKDLNYFVERDFNHPSVIMWSVGNEIPEQETDLGAATAKQIVKQIKGLDPGRPVTIGANTSGEVAANFLGAFDVVGYNYQKHNYIHDHDKGYANVMYGSETYPKEAYEYWQFVEEYPFVIGDFVWTGWDYLGEASIGWTGYGPGWKGIGPFPWTLAYTGEIDVMGNWRPAAYYRQVLWKTGNAPISAFVQSPTLSLSPEPNPDWYDYWTYADIHPNWTWPIDEHHPLSVTVYSLYPRIELSLNGETVGTKVMTKADKLTASFTVPYQPGKLVAKGYDGKGQLQSTWHLETTGKPKTVSITREQASLKADGHDINYLAIQLLDENQRAVYHWQFDQALKVEVDGAASLFALGNGSPNSAESFHNPHRHTFRGKLLAVIQSNGKSGEVRIKVSGKGLKEQNLRFTVPANN